MPQKARIKLPDQATVGEVIDVKALISHVMETGNRKLADGTPIPRNIIHTFMAFYAGEPVFAAEFGPGISANPYLSFKMTVPGPGEFEMTWIDDMGETTTERASLNVVEAPAPPAPTTP